MAATGTRNRATSSKARKPGSSYRYADAWPCAEGLRVVGVRYDEEDVDRSVSYLITWAQGSVACSATHPGVAEAVVEFGGTCCVLFSDHRLVQLGNGDAILMADDVIDVVATSGSLVALRGDGAIIDITAGGAIMARVPGGIRLACDGSRLSVLTADAVLDLHGRVVLSGGGSAIATSDHLLAVVHGRELLLDDGQQCRILTSSHPLACVAISGGHIFAASRTSGLLVVDESRTAFVPLRPSLRARSLRVGSDQLVVTSDLLVATSTDGEDFLSRDLTAFIRIAETQD